MFEKKAESQKAQKKARKSVQVSFALPENLAKKEIKVRANYPIGITLQDHIRLMVEDYLETFE
jgi:hypothetical protein